MNFSINGPGINPSNILKTRRKKFGLGGFIFLSLFGLVFLVMGLAFFFLMQIPSDWSRTPGSVISATRNTDSDGKVSYKPLVSYTVNGEIYQVTSISTSSSNPVGQSREVAYDPGSPANAKVDEGNNKYFVLIFAVAGASLMVGSVIALIRSRKRTAAIKRLTENGHKLQGLLADIKSTGSNNNTTTYKLIVSATDLNGVVQYYESDTIAGVGGLAMADFRSNPIPIDVYINYVNPAEYYVDLSDVPDLTPQRITDLLSLAKSKFQNQTDTTATHTDSDETQHPIPPLSGVQ